MKKMTKRFLSAFLVVVMLLSVLPINAFAMSKRMYLYEKSGGWINYTNYYCGYFSEGSSGAPNYFGFYLTGVDKNRSVTVKKGSSFSVSLYSGTYTSKEATNGVPNNNYVHWHYGSNSDFKIASYDNSYGAISWYAFYDSPYTSVTSSVTGSTLATNGTTNDFRVTDSEGKSNTPYGTFNFTSSSFSQLNTPGVYTVYLCPTVAFNRWENGNHWQTYELFGAAYKTYDSYSLSYVKNNCTIPITVTVTGDYKFNNYAGTTVKTYTSSSATTAYNNRPSNTSSSSYFSNNNGTHSYYSYSWPTSPNSSLVFQETRKTNTYSCDMSLKGSLISAATVDSPAIYKKKCSVCGYEAGTMEVGDKLPSMKVSYTDPLTNEEIDLGEATNDNAKELIGNIMKRPMQKQNNLFLGWYDDKNKAINKNATRFDMLTNITADYAGIGYMDKDSNDDKMIPAYKTFGLAGVQIREDRTQEHFEEGEDKLEGDVYGGLRYVASFSEQLKSIVENNANVEYGFVMASRANAEMFARNYGVAYDKYEIKYNLEQDGETVARTADTDFRYVTNVVCSNNIDHRNFDGYRLFTAVIDYEGAESLKDTEFVARAYVKYVDANGNTQIYYDDYDGTTTFGGCSVSYNQALAMSM